MAQLTLDGSSAFYFTNAIFMLRDINMPHWRNPQSFYWFLFFFFFFGIKNNSQSSSLGTHSEKAMAPHSSTLAWKIPWMEEPGGLQFMGWLRVGHNWATSLSLLTFVHWRRKWQPTPVFLPGESQGRGSLVGYCLWGRTESDTTEATQQQQQQQEHTSLILKANPSRAPPVFYGNSYCSL